MRALVVLFAYAAISLSAQQAFSVKDVLSAPYALGLTASPVGARFAWIENAQGVRNIWVAGSHEAARQITQYTEDDGQGIGGLTWSPDGMSIAYALGAENGAGGKPANPAELQRNTAVVVWVASVSKGVEPFRIGEGRSPFFEPVNHGLLFVRNGQIWRASTGAHCSPATGCVPELDGQPEQLVFDRGSASGLAVSPDGKLLTYVSRRRGHSFIGLYEFATRKLQFVSPSSGNDSAPSFSPDGKQLAWLRDPFTEAKEFEANRVSAYPWSVQVASLDDLAARTVYQPEANKIGSVIPRFATGSPRVWWAAGEKVLFCSEVDGWVHLYSVVAGEKAVLLTPGKYEVEDVSVSGDGRKVMWAGNSTLTGILEGPLDRVEEQMRLGEEDVDRRHLWSMEVPTMDRGPFGFKERDKITTRPVSLSDGKVVALASSAFVPMHPVWVRDDGSLRDVKSEWVPKSYPASGLVTPKQVVFRAHVGSSVAYVSEARQRLHRPSFADEIERSGVPGTLMIHGQMFLPQRTADSSAALQNDNKKSGDARAVVKRPAIVFFHGGPRRQMLLGYPAMDYYSNAYAMNQYLAAQGYLVLSVNYRCGIGYGLEFRQCEHSGADGASEYNDALAAVEYLRSRGDVDMKRVGIWGGSYGGYFTALGLARNSDLFAAGVDFHGVHDWTREDNAPSDWLKGTNAEVDAIAKLAVASSPMADVAKWRSPVLLIHGDDDPEVAYNQTPLLADALRAKGVHVEELIFPDEVHGFLLHKDWVKAYEAEADFFARMLKKPAAQ